MPYQGGRDGLHTSLQCSPYIVSGRATVDAMVGWCEQDIAAIDSGLILEHRCGGLVDTFDLHSKAFIHSITACVLEFRFKLDIIGS